jgi:cytochrome c-type biogenesis protein CcmH/NrfG
VDAAVELLRRAIAADPAYSPAYYHLADFLAESGRKDDATGVWQDLLKAVPGDARARAALGQP